MYIYLTRHGETIWNVDKRTQGVQDIPLSKRGIRQAEALAERLANENISTIYTSNLERAYRTAEIIGNRAGLIPIRKEELNEVNFGEWEGLTLKQIKTDYPGMFEKFYKDFSYAPEHGESLNAVQNRIHSFIRFIKKNHCDRDDRILVVSHTYPVRMLILELMSFSTDLLLDFQLDNTGISIIKLDDNTKRMICLNDVCHLKN